MRLIEKHFHRRKANARLDGVTQQRKPITPPFVPDRTVSAWFLRTPLAQKPTRHARARTERLGYTVMLGVSRRSGQHSGDATIIASLVCLIFF